MPTTSSSFKRAFEDLSTAPSDGELAQLRATATLSRLQVQVVAEDFAFAAALAGFAAHERAAMRATAIALLGQLAAATGVGALPADAVAAIVLGTEDSDESVRLAATQAGVALTGDDAHHALVRRLGDAAALVRLQALQGLHARGGLDDDPDARQAAGALRDDPDRLVAELARNVAAD